MVESLERLLFEQFKADTMSFQSMPEKSHDKCYSALNCPDKENEMAISEDLKIASFTENYLEFWEDVRK